MQGIQSVEKQGRTVEEVLVRALQELGLDREDVEIEILEDGRSGFLGIGARSARVRVTPKAARPAETPSKETSEEGVPQGATPVPAAEEDTADATAVDPDRAKELLSGILERMGMPSVIETRHRDGRLVLNIVGSDANLLIGKKGQTLGALQFLVNLMYSKSEKRKARFVIDVEEYRLRREKRLQTIAYEVRDKVRRTGRPVSIAPMNAQERRIIHMALRDDPDVKTTSRGEGPLRKVVVLPR